MEVSKFIINDNDVYVKDAEARSEIASQSESMSEIQSEIDSQSVAYSEMFSEVDEDIELKQDSSDAWKIGTVSATRSNLSILAGTYATIQSPAVSGSNVIPLFAYCPAVTQLTCIRLTTDGNIIQSVMDNIGSSTISGDVSITIVYAYK